MQLRSRKSTGFTLIELLIVVAIIGLVAALAIPNLLNAIQRSKQKRTMSDLRAIATALESYAVDNNSYPDIDGLTDVLIVPLQPNYMRNVPTTDAWGHNTLYAKLDPATAPRAMVCAAMLAASRAWTRVASTVLPPIAALLRPARGSA